MTDGALAAPEQPPVESLRGTAVRSAAWVAVDKWGSRVLQLIVFAVLGRILGSVSFGLVALASSVIAIMNLFVDQGFSKALIQRRELDTEHCDAAFWTGMATAAVLALLVVALAAPISDAVGEPRLTPVLRWLALLLPLGAMQTTPVALMERSFRYAGLAGRHLAGALVGGVVGIVCAVLGAGVWSLVVSSLVTAAVSVAVLWSVSAWRPRLRFSRRHFRELRTFSLNVLGIEIVALVGQNVDRFVIAAVLGPSALGYYYIGYNVLLIAVDTTSAVIAQVALPSFSRLQDARDRLRDAFTGATRLSVTLAMPIFAGLAALAPVVINLLFGPDWDRSVPVMQALAALGAINAAAYFDRSVLLAVDRSRDALLIAVAQALLNVAIVAGTAHLGILAVAIGVAARQYVEWPLRIWLLRRAIGLRIGPYLLPWGQALLAAGVMVAAVLPLRAELEDVSLLLAAAVCVPVGAVVYFAALRLVAPRTWAEIAALAPRLRRQARTT